VEKTMSKFVLLFRMDITTEWAQPTPVQMEEYMKEWDKWIKSISAKGKLADGGNHLSREGRVIKPGNVIKNGPYTKKKKSVAGYILVKAANLEDAVKLARTCPILNGKGTSVEVRKVEAR